jgi:hypothetical protein
MSEPNEELEAWMARNRIRRAGVFLELKIEKAERRKFKSIMLPIPVAKAILRVLNG